MWQRFTERARRVVFYAQEECQRFGHSYVAPEHLLLGLVREQDSMACQTLKALGVTPEMVKSAVIAEIELGESKASQDMTLTPGAKRVIDQAYAAARELNNDYIGSQHLLLGIIAGSDSMAGKVLARLGVDANTARDQVIRLQGAAGMKAADEGSGKPSFFSRMDAEVKAVMMEAGTAAKDQKAGYIATEHLWLGIIADRSNIACRALLKLNVQPQQLEEAMRPYLYSEGFEPRGAMLTPQAKAVMEAAERDSDTSGSKLFNSGHLLIALFRDGHGIAGRVLRALGISAEALETAVAEATA